MVWNFLSARTVRVVYHLPKISGLARRVRLDSSYNMKLDSAKLKKLVNGKRISNRNIKTGKTGLPFQNFLLSAEFSSGTNQKNVYHLHPDSSSFYLISISTIYVGQLESICLIKPP